MNTLLLISSILLWLAVLLLGFLLLGALRAIDLLRWRVEQMEATTPSRMGRSGLRVGKKAPDFTLPSATSPPNLPLRIGEGGKGGEVSLHDYAGRKVLLVFTQAGCGPCQQIVPELNRLHDAGKVEVVAINKGEPEATRKWVAEANIRFPVVMQPAFTTSKRYEVFATPFAFLIDEQGLIASKGLANSKQHIGFVLDPRRDGAKPNHAEPDNSQTDVNESDDSHPISQTVEVNHD
jgi:methylamine dehydrogenase accessory protein MauD